MVTKYRILTRVLMNKKATRLIGETLAPKIPHQPHSIKGNAANDQ